MNIFRLKEYWRYRRAAKGRHGVHSPFVYRFIEEALRPPAGSFKHTAAYESATGEPWHPDRLLWRIAQHFRFHEIVVLSPDGMHVQLFRAEHTKPDVKMQKFFGRLYDWQALLPGQWEDCFRKDSVRCGRNDVIVIGDIHDSPAHAASWTALCQQPEVRLSLDLFRVGLLFFSEDFKERQHFVLKYPL